MDADDTLEATLPTALPYVLTDGCRIAELRWMSLQDFALANERALIATGSAWEWVLYSDNQFHEYI